MTCPFWHETLTENPKHDYGLVRLYSCQSQFVENEEDKKWLRSVTCRDRRIEPLAGSIRPGTSE